MKKHIYIVFLFFTTFQFNAQNVNLDSLWQVWNDKSQHDTIRLKTMHKIAWNGYLFTQPDSAFYFAQIMYDYASKKNLEIFKVKALVTQGTSFGVRSEYSNAMKYFNDALIIQEKIGDKLGMTQSLNNIGLVYFHQGNFTKAVESYNKCIEIQKQLGDDFGVAATLGNIGLIYQEQGNYTEAIKHYTASLKIEEKINHKQGIASTLNNIALIYQNQNDHDKSIEYLLKNLKICEEIGDKRILSSTYQNLGNAYFDKKQYDKAEEFYKKSLQIKIEMDDKSGIAGSTGNLGNIYFNQRKFKEAKEQYEKSLKVEKEIGNMTGVSIGLFSLGNVYYEENNFLKALDYSRNALKTAQEIGSAKEIQNAANSLWKTNKKLGNHKESLEMYELYITMRDSVQSEDNQRAVIQQEYKYEYEKQAAVDSIANAQKSEIQQAQIAKQEAEIKSKRNQQFALIGGLTMVVVFAGFMYNRFKVTQKQKIVIEQKEKQTQEQNVLITQQKKEVEQQKYLIEEKNHEILDSINYAKRIQNAILPPQKVVKQYLQESFILYQPKDIVAGDFYWLEHKENKILFAAADCTGHGVPGAMVSVICNNGLNRSVREHGLTIPGEILNKTRDIVIQEFEKSEEEVKDGMDISLCCLEDNKLQWAGANNPLWIIRKESDEIEEIKPDKQPIGKYAESKPFTTHCVELNKGDSIYIFSDGYADQFGGEQGKKFKSANFKKLLLSVRNEPMEQQRELIGQAFDNWKGELEQLDDVCVIGVRI